MKEAGAANSMPPIELLSEEDMLPGEGGGTLVGGGVEAGGNSEAAPIPPSPEGGGLGRVLGQGLQKARGLIQKTGQLIKDSAQKMWNWIKGVFGKSPSPSTPPEGAGKHYQR